MTLAGSAESRTLRGTAADSEPKRLADWTVRAASSTPSSSHETGRAESPLGEDERAALGLGLTCHAVYHAGQILPIKRQHG